MAIGTTVKVGFDGNEVKKGFGGIKSVFSSMGKGMAMGAGAMMSKSLVDLALKAITGIDALADFAGEAQDTALMVGSSTEEIIKLNRALDLAGSELDAGKMLSNLNVALFDASHGGTELQEKLAKLKLTMGDFRGKTTMDSFNMIGKKAAESKMEIGELDDTLRDLFGGKIGPQLIMLFKNNNVLEQAEQEVGALAHSLGLSADAIGKVQDQFKRIPYLWRAYNLNLFNGIQEAFGTDWVKDVFDFATDLIDPEGIRSVVKDLRDFFNEMSTGEGLFTNIFDKLVESFSALGKTIGEGLMESLKGSFSLGNIFGGGKTTQIDPIKEIQRTNEILSRIYRDGGALYA